MKCECKERIEAMLLDNFKLKDTDAKNHSAKLQGYGIAMTGNSLQMRAMMGVNLTANHTLKNGTHKVKTTKMSMFFSYCPFCGVKATGETE
jgi:hypothetical protein